MGFDMNAGWFGAAVGSLTYVTSWAVKTFLPNAFPAQSLQLAPSGVAGTVGQQVFSAVNIGGFNGMALVMFALGGALLMAAASSIVENVPWIAKPKTVFLSVLSLVATSTLIGTAYLTWTAQASIANLFSLSLLWNVLLSSVIVSSAVAALVQRGQFFKLSVPWKG